MKNKNYRFELPTPLNPEKIIKRGDEDDDDFDDFFSNSVSKDENRIYFYSDIDRSSILKLNTTLRKTTNMMTNRANNLSQDVGNIFLHINSMGGTLFDGLIASDYIRINKVPVHTIIDGAAASAATIISIVGKKRYINKNSFMLIHQLSSGAYGTFANIKDEMHNCNILMKTLKDMYKQYTKIPTKKLEQILQHDIWFTAEECLKYGLVDEIVE